LRGVAKNLPDGSVEVEVVGADEALDALEKWLWQGPPLAKVTQVQRQPLEAGAAYEGFDTR